MRNTCLNEVYQLAKKNEKILFIGSDLGAGTLSSMKYEMPEQFFMEGISEQHIIGMSAGLAMEGFIPYVNSIAPFLTRRCYEQVLIDLCLHDLPVRLIGNGGGVVYAPLGPTHLAVEDLAIFRAIPNMTIIAPCDAEEMHRLMPMTVDWPHPIYIRLAKGGDKVVSNPDLDFEIGKAILMRPPKDGLFITTGVMAQKALEASSQLLLEGIDCGVLHMHTVKPLDHNALINLIPKVNAVVTIEEHYRIGGLGSAVLETCSDLIPKHTSKITRLGFPDKFADQYGSQETLTNYWGINVESIKNAMLSKLNNK
jgi:transketolase|tara:strand:- start:9 stop:938 length:930 start_codon:yes stop_codon:yes gene_type:complete